MARSKWTLRPRLFARSPGSEWPAVTASDAGGPRGFADMRPCGIVAIADPTTLLETGWVLCLVSMATPWSAGCPSWYRHHDSLWESHQPNRSVFWLYTWWNSGMGGYWRGRLRYV